METMEVDRSDGRTPNQLRPLACSRNVLHRAHGSARWSQGNTIVLAAVYGPKAGTRKGENPEKASVEVVLKPKTGQIGKHEKEYEMVLKRTLQSICLLTVHPNTTTSIIVQVVDDDGALLPCAINASCAALVDAGIPQKHLAVSICCGLTESGSIMLDPTMAEEQKMQAFAYLVFPNSPLSVLPKAPSSDEDEPIEHGVITSVTHGAMSGTIHIGPCLSSSTYIIIYISSGGEEWRRRIHWETISTVWNVGMLRVQRSQNFLGEAFSCKPWGIQQKLRNSIIFPKRWHVRVAPLD